MTDAQIDELVEAGYLLGQFVAVRVTLPDVIASDDDGDEEQYNAASIAYIAAIADGTDTPLCGSTELAETLRAEGASPEQAEAQQADRRRLQHAIQHAAGRLLRQMTSMGQQA